MDVQITYETLFDLLRKERSLEELQSLDDSFWTQVVNFVNDRKSFFERTGNDLNQEKSRIQLQNIKRILKEIYERREKKIVNLALNIIKTDNTGFADKRNMLPSEKEFFTDTLNLFNKYKQGVLLQVFNGQIPLIAPVELAVPKSDDSVVDSSSSVDGSSSSSDSSSETVVSNLGSVSDVSSDVPQLKDGTMIVKFKSDVPKFLGRNKEIFGPYESGKITQLPVKIAQILIKKGKAESVMGSE